MHNVSSFKRLDLTYKTMTAFLGLLCIGLHAPEAAPARDEFPTVQLPSIPDRSVNIVDFGAVPDGKTLSTEAFAKAIHAASEQGGGRVVVPQGIWLTGPIVLKSSIDLHADEGALIVFSGDLELYRDENGKISNLISGKNLENIAITGRGVFEGSGDLWRPVKRFKMTDKQWKALLKRGGVLTRDDDIWWPAEEYVDLKRPRLVRLDDCKRILIEDASFRNSPQFALDISDCEELTIRNAHVFNFWYAQNGDGIDLHSCRNVQIVGTRVDVGDDALCMKSNTGKPLENVLIENCIVYHGHGGFVTGSEELGGMNNIRVRNCTFMGTDVGIRFKSARDRGGLVTNIDIQHVNMINIKEQAILFDMHYEDDLPIDEEGMITRPLDAEIPAVTDTTPRFQNISIRDVTCRGAERAVLMAGLPEMATRNIHLENISITAETGMICMDAQDITLKNVEILNEEGPALHFFNAQNVSVEGFRYNEKLKTALRLQGTQNDAITVAGFQPPLTAENTVLAEGAAANDFVPPPQ